uniref:NAC family transcription factor n=1 Tax=Melilotus albus TaxID=47082 RepID=A0A896WDP3_MELAB|nr:NAC family transcription factor [Melilotus albus]
MALNSSSNKDLTPTDDELLQPFLYNKIHNIPLPNDINILEYDLFDTEKNPWEIWEEFGDLHSYCEKDLYFFTTLKKKSATSAHLNRSIGIGTWEGKETGEIIVANDKQKLLGLKKYFRFEKSNTYHDGGWILHEYSLHKSLISNPSANNYVLCRFRKNFTALPRKNTGTKNIVPGRAATTTSENNNVLLGENIDQIPRNQLNNSNNKNEAVKTTNETGCAIHKEDYSKCILNKEDDSYIYMDMENGDLIMSKEDGDGVMNKEEKDEEEEDEEEEDSDLHMTWLLSMQLREKNEGCLIEDEDVQMLPNNFYKDLLSENFDIK